MGVLLDLRALQSFPCSHLQLEVPTSEFSGLLPASVEGGCLDHPGLWDCQQGVSHPKDRPWGWILLPGCSSQSLLGVDTALALLGGAGPGLLLQQGPDVLLGSAHPLVT